MSEAEPKGMRYVVYMLILALVILHQDFWWWDRAEPFIFGFIPVGLMWHVGISIMAAVVGALAVRFCWPQDVEVPDDEAAPAYSSPRHRGK